MKRKLLFWVSTSLFLISSLWGFNAIAAKSPMSIVYVYSNSCRMCDVFESNVLSDSSVKNELKNFQFKKVNIMSAPNLANQVRVTPTIIIYNSKNQAVKKFVPPLNKNKFIDILKSVQ